SRSGLLDSRQSTATPDRSSPAIRCDPARIAPGHLRARTPTAQEVPSAVGPARGQTQKNHPLLHEAFRQAGSSVRPCREPPGKSASQRSLDAPPAGTAPPVASALSPTSGPATPRPEPSLPHRTAPTAPNPVHLSTGNSGRGTSVKSGSPIECSTL